MDDQVLDELEEALIASDVGVDTTLRIIDRIEERVRRDKYVNTEELNRYLREEIEALLLENKATNQVMPFDFSKTFCDPGCRGKWRGKNNYHWKTGCTTESLREESHGGGCRYIQGSCH